MLGRSYGLNVNYIAYLPFIRLFCLKSISEIFLSSILIYTSRKLERNYGPNKYFSMLLITLLIASGLEHIVKRFMSNSHLNLGPFPFLGICFYLYYYDIPGIHDYHILGIKLNNKAFIYSIGIQLLLQSGKHSFFPFFCGIVATIIYSLNFCNIQKIKVPKAIARVASYVYDKTLSDVDRVQQRRQVSEDSWVRRAPTPSGIHQPFGIGGISDRPPELPLDQVSEELVGQLVAMGFDRERSCRALSQSFNNVQGAIAAMLQG
uniref:UBA domain-containing protein n=1 Tax=Polytomella parva TaxID=51329 RepID=A0A7S0VNB2_9CHLO|mmetsp:Transcript_9884/g.18434  ORF Transcript_9884/g.18434 Transcript_9884/m.18434 type:complete len:262 (+) Transcript_9884:260-1045(+)